MHRPCASLARKPSSHRGELLLAAERPLGATHARAPVARDLAQLGHAQFVAGDVQDAIDTMIRARDLCSEDSGMYEVLNDLVGEYQRSRD